MEHDIKRINSYDYPGFDKEILRQHGAFVVDDRYRCGFKITGEDSAIVYYEDKDSLYEVIDEFRFYTEHITSFFDMKGNLIKSFPPIEVFEIDIDKIQPSQFYVDEDKVNAIKSFIGKEEDLIIPLTKSGERFISLDGHTRLYYAAFMGYKKVKGFITEADEYIFKFAQEAVNRGILSPKDLVMISHEDYKIKWNKFCEDFFKSN